MGLVVRGQLVALQRRGGQEVALSYEEAAWALGGVQPGRGREDEEQTIACPVYLRRGCPEGQYTVS